MRDKTSFMQFLLTISLSETTLVKIPRNWVAWWRHSMNDNKQHTAEAHRKLDGICIVLLTSCRNTISNKYTANRFDFFFKYKDYMQHFFQSLKLLLLLLYLLSSLLCLNTCLNKGDQSCRYPRRLKLKR